MCICMYIYICAYISATVPLWHQGSVSKALQVCQSSYSGNLLREQRGRNYRYPHDPA